LKLFLSQHPKSPYTFPYLDLSTYTCLFLPVSLEKILSCKQERKRERTGKKNERERDRKEKKNKAEDVLLGNVPNVRTHETGEW
jgi:hypothetical protein